MLDRACHPCFRDCDLEYVKASDRLSNHLLSEMYQFVGDFKALVPVLTELLKPGRIIGFLQNKFLHGSISFGLVSVELAFEHISFGAHLNLSNFLHLVTLHIVLPHGLLLRGELVCARTEFIQFHALLSAESRPLC
jgi:hypothetical protein